jgi:hypothetical protein
MERRWSPGQAAVIREVWAGAFFQARSCVVVEDLDPQTTFYVPPGAPCAVPIDEGGTELRIPSAPWRHAIRANASPVLSFAWPNTPYAVLLMWHADGTPHRWYVNLQAPLARTRIGFDTVDHVLDVVIPPDRSGWGWKDEDDLARAVDVGLFTPEDARWFAWWGERAVEHVLLRQPPFDLDWEDWRPDPDWAVPRLPADWSDPPGGW